MIGKIFALCFSLLISMGTNAQPEPAGMRPSFELVKNLIVKERITSIDELISKLPFSYRENFTLMRQSKSSQSASDQFPRVIMFGDDAKSILTFNGDPSQAGYQVVEVMDFNDTTSAFELYRIDFAGVRPKFSEKNPRACMGCHESSKDSPKPNWDSYGYDTSKPFWRGAFGAYDDGIINEDERKSLLEFLTSRPQMDRYRHLKIQIYNKLSPFSESPKGPLITDRPNFRLTLLLNALNAKKVVAEMKKHPDFYFLRDLLLLSQDSSENLKLIRQPEMNEFIGYEKLIEARRLYQHIALTEPILKKFTLTRGAWQLQLQTRNEAAQPANADQDLQFNDGVEGIMSLVVREFKKDWWTEHEQLIGRYNWKLFEGMARTSRLDRFTSRVDSVELPEQGLKILRSSVYSEFERRRLRNPRCETLFSY